MITDDIAPELMNLVIGLLLCWLLAFVFVRSYRVDALRDRLFNLRGELFDYAAEGGIRFDDPAYRQLREHMNSMIRYAHRFTFSRLCLSVWFHARRDGVGRARERWNQTLKSVRSEAAREKLQNFHTRMLIIAGTHLLSGSIFLMLHLCVWCLKRIATNRAVRQSPVKGSLTRGVDSFVVRRLGPDVAQLESEVMEAQLNGKGSKASSGNRCTS